MKYTTASMFAAVIGALVVAACAGGSEVPPAGDDESTQNATAKSDAGQDAGKDEAKKCVSSCSSDDDCANSCPAPTSGGPQCCDLVTKTCFHTQESVCPKSDQNDGGTPLQY